MLISNFCLLIIPDRVVDKNTKTYAEFLFYTWMYDLHLFVQIYIFFKGKWSQINHQKYE